LQHIAKTLKANSKEKYKMTMELNKNDGLYDWKTEHQALTPCKFFWHRALSDTDEKLEKAVQLDNAGSFKCQTKICIPTLPASQINSFL